MRNAVARRAKGRREVKFAEPILKSRSHAPIRFGETVQMTSRQQLCTRHSWPHYVNTGSRFASLGEDYMVDIQRRISESFNSQAMMKLMGAELVRVADGEVHIGLHNKAELSQQHGFLHGGAIATLLDCACGYAALTKALGNDEVVTSEFKINFLRPAVGTYFLAVGKVFHDGTRFTVCTGEVRQFDEEKSAMHKVVAMMQASFANLRKK